jgi:citrate synthase
VSEYPTAIGTSTPDAIWLLGHNLADDLLGKISFSELAFWLAARRRPTADEVKVFDTVLVSLADHGFTPTAIAARMTYYSAPDSLQGAIAAGLLGGGSRFLGVTEDTGLYLDASLAEVGDTRDWTDADYDRAASALLKRARENRQRIPGLGHPVHKQRDPRTAVIIAVAREAGTYGPHLALFEAIGRVQTEILGRSLPLNGAGVAGAALADLGLPVDLLRGFALLARTAGLIGHLVEERIDPVAPSIYAEVDRNAVYRPLES